MLHTYASHFIHLHKLLEVHAEHINEKNLAEQGGLKAALQNSMEAIETICRRIGLTQSALQARRVIGKINGEPDLYTDLTLSDQYKVLRVRILDELDGRMFLYVASDDALLYKQKEPFGVEVSAKLADTQSDIDEASKCLALGRYTACVFHLMRAMEKSVQTFAVVVGAFATLPDDRMWKNITDQIHRVLYPFYPPGTPGPSPAQTAATRALQDKYSESYKALDSARVAWRNRTMHPKVTYTEEEARNAYAATKWFMGELAGVL
jgi:hypothetical protein